jgi:DNA-binding NarL/FixJ family response regulator
MNKLNAAMVKKMNGSLKIIEGMFEKEPVIMLDDKKSYWLNESAQDFISQKKIPQKDFMEWLLIGSSHLRHLSYGDTRIQLMSLPGTGTAAFLRHETPEASCGEIDLTTKQREVLRFLIKGYSNKQIAAHMKVTPGTVNTHLDAIYHKLNCSNRLSACFTALKHGLIVAAREVSPTKKK